jgi:tetratricopeptide (TPR) repeat protein
LEHDDLVARGNAFLKTRLLRQALDCFEQALGLAESTFQLAETYHAIATVNLELGDLNMFFTNENNAAEHFAQIDPGQSGDFMKRTGDILSRIEESNLARQAYRRASEFFERQSSIEEEKSYKLAWKAWGHFCLGKYGDDASTHFKKAARLFRQASKYSTDSIRASRTSNAYRCFALGYLTNPKLELELRVGGARRNIKKALYLEPNNEAFKTCNSSLKLLTALVRTSGDKKAFSVQFHRCCSAIEELKTAIGHVEYSDSLVKDIDQAATLVRSNPNNLDTIDQLLSILSKVVVVIL